MFKTVALCVMEANGPPEFIQLGLNEIFSTTTAYVVLYFSMKPPSPNFQFPDYVLKSVDL